jgi:hypothetical protein
MQNETTLGIEKTKPIKANFKRGDSQVLSEDG